MLSCEVSAEAIILEEAEYKLEEVTCSVDKIMAEVRKRTRVSLTHSLPRPESLLLLHPQQNPTPLLHPFTSSPLN